MKTNKLLPPVYILTCIVLMAALHFVAPVAQLVPSPWNFLGVIPLAVGIVLNIVADRAFSRAGTTVKPFEQSSSLITSGVYRLSRHPMYLGLVLVVLGIALLTGSLTPFVVVPIFALLLDRNFITVEERMLEERFGPVWLAYKEKVRRWV